MDSKVIAGLLDCSTTVTPLSESFVCIAAPTSDGLIPKKMHQV